MKQVSLYSGRWNETKAPTCASNIIPYLVHNLKPFFTSQITLGRRAQSVNPSTKGLIWSDGSHVSRFKPWASQD